jgi:hypothetical protein
MGANWASPMLRPNSFMSDSFFGSFTSQLDLAAPWSFFGLEYSAPISSHFSPCRGFAPPRLWRIFLAIAFEYIAIAFAADFILAPLQASGLEKYPVTYLPFALLLIGGAGLRFVVFWDRRLRPLLENLFLKVAGPSPLFHFDRMSRKDHLAVWPALLFVAPIVVLLALDHALWGTLESALALYGPPIAVLGVICVVKVGGSRSERHWSSSLIAVDVARCAAVDCTLAAARRPWRSAWCRQRLGRNYGLVTGHRMFSVPE